MAKQAKKELGPVAMKDDTYSEYDCKYDAEKVEATLALMQDKQKWPRIKAHLEKRKKALMTLDDVMKKVQGGE